MAAGYNQYIGMRYVPIIDGVWSNSKAYEPLVVVSYDGNSYISKTYVPAGTLPTNETYWLLSANYNAQIEQYRAEVRQYQTQVEGVEEELETAQQDIDELNTFKNTIFNTIHPVGSIVELETGTDPQTFYGVGTWTDIGGNDIANVGTSTDISAYTSESNRFTFPENGLVRTVCNYRQGSISAINLYNQAGTYIAQIGDASTAANAASYMAGNSGSEIQVFKGFSCYCTLGSSYDSVRFYPYNYRTHLWKRIS